LIENSPPGVIRVRQQFYWLQRVVYTGIDINQISRVDTSKGTFTFDFYLWFRYAGDDEVRSVDLNAATEKSPTMKNRHSWAETGWSPLQFVQGPRRLSQNLRFSRLPV
jgi:hypothetical protein